MTIQTSTLNDIMSNADSDDLARVIDAVKARRKVLSTLLAASVRPGMRAEIVAVSPKALVGLTGTVRLEPGGRNRWRLDLDDASRDAARYGRARSHVHGDAESGAYYVTGLPAQCLREIGA